MERGELGTKGYQRQNPRWPYERLRILCWRLLLFAVIISVADDLFAQGGVPTEPQPTSTDFNITSQPLEAALNAFAKTTG